jgi:hypothetical protein
MIALSPLGSRCRPPPLLEALVADGVGIAIRRRSSRLDVQQRCGDVQRGLGGNEDDIMAAVFADEVEWLTDVLAARDAPMDDGSSGER